MEGNVKVVKSVTDRAAVLSNSVAESGVPLGSELLAIGAQQNQCLLQAATCVPVGHAVPTMEGNVLAGLVGQQLQQFQLHGRRVGLLLVSIEELQRWRTQ